MFLTVYLENFELFAFINRFDNLDQGVVDKRNVFNGFFLKISNFLLLSIDFRTLIMVL